MFLSVVILGRFTTETHAMAPSHQGPTHRHLHHIRGRIFYDQLPTRITDKEDWLTLKSAGQQGNMQLSTGNPPYSIPSYSAPMPAAIALDAPREDRAPFAVQMAPRPL